MVSYQAFAPEGIGSIHPGDDLGRILGDALEKEGLQPRNGDILVLAHKIVSKAEGRIRRLSEVTPSPRAMALARRTGKEPPLVEVILQESDEVLWAGPGLLLCRQHLGLVCANAAVDCSNAGEQSAVLLPEDPDRSAAQLRRTLEERFCCRLGVVICDTHGRPFREGAGGIVIGASGTTLLKSYIGQRDRDGRVMHSSVEAVGDELAAAATLLMEQSGASRPAVLIRGLSLPGEDAAASTVREQARDVFLSALQNTKGEEL